VRLLNNIKMKGQIIKIISDNYYVKSHHKIYICKARGRFRKDNIKPLVGDLVLIDIEKKYIIDILPRHNELTRPSIANVDQAMILISVKEPNLALDLLDKMLIIIQHHNIKPIICFTKLDLLTKMEKQFIRNLINYYRKLGYLVFTNQQLFWLKRIFKNKITVLAGQSGVGKSTLLNKLNKDLNLSTKPISLALGRGKHTTKHVKLLEVSNGLIADTPGFSAVNLTNITNEAIRDNFIEFHQYKKRCQYRNCFHLNEVNCEVKKMVQKGKILESRYQNYQCFIKSKEGNHD